MVIYKKLQLPFIIYLWSVPTEIKPGYSTSFTNHQKAAENLVIGKNKIGELKQDFNWLNYFSTLPAPTNRFVK